MKYAERVHEESLSTGVGASPMEVDSLSALTRKGKGKGKGKDFGKSSAKHSNDQAHGFGKSGSKDYHWCNNCHRHVRHTAENCWYSSSSKGLGKSKGKRKDANGQKGLPYVARPYPEQPVGTEQLQEVGSLFVLTEDHRVSL